MEWIIVLDEDWGDREETGSLCLAACCSQQPHNCQISKIGINHRPQTYFPLLLPLSVSLPFYISYVLPHFMSLSSPLPSSFIRSSLKHFAVHHDPRLLWSILSLHTIVCLFLINNSQDIQIEDESCKISSNNTQPNWLVSSATLNSQFYKVLLGRQR